MAKMDQVFDSYDSGKDTKKRRVFLIVSVCVLLIALAVSAVLLLGKTDISEERIERILEFGTVIDGVTLGGTKLDGMTSQEARAATDGQEEALITATKLSFDVGGVVSTLDAKTVGLKSDYETVISDAIYYGRTGSFDERAAQIQSAQTGGGAFDIRVTGDQMEVKAAIVLQDETFNNDARDASYIFMPNGYYEDGKPFEPAKYNGKQQDFSGLVRIPDEQMPNRQRYQYWKKTKYIDNHIPPHANISRFLYIEEQRGLATNMEALSALIVEAAENADFSTITVPTEVTEPKVTLEQVKEQTQLVSSWTTWYGHSSVAGRAFNVGLLSSMLNGAVVEPGDTFSVNRYGGPRTSAKGFKAAGAISGGAMVNETGGGVCQVSSTLYNAALRTNLEIVEANRHTIPSSYLPRGLDAAISGVPDLKFKNDKDVPIFIVAYMDYKEKSITFEVYGPTVKHETYGDVILHFDGKRTGGSGAPGTTVREASQLPDGTKINPGETKVWAEARGSTHIDVYVHYLDLNGKELGKKKAYSTSHPSIRGVSYHNPAPTPTPPPPPTNGGDGNGDPTDPTANGNGEG